MCSIDCICCKLWYVRVNEDHNKWRKPSVYGMEYLDKTFKRNSAVDKSIIDMLMLHMIFLSAGKLKRTLFFGYR